MREVIFRSGGAVVIKPLFALPNRIRPVERIERIEFRMTAQTRNVYTVLQRRFADG